MDGCGYVQLLLPDHPNAKRSGYVAEHILVVARALGEAVPKGSPVHHVDGNRANNDPRNLVLCQDNAYHRLLHRRQRALDECGHANWLQCRFCGAWESPDPIIIHLNPDGRHAQHRKCAAAEARRRNQHG